MTPFCVPHQIYRCAICDTKPEDVTPQAIHAYIDVAYRAGFKAGIKEAAQVAENHAKENGPVFIKSMGGFAIAVKIRKLGGYDE